MPYIYIIRFKKSLTFNSFRLNSNPVKKMVDIIPRKGLLFLDIIIKQLASCHVQQVCDASYRLGVRRATEEQGGAEPRIVRNAGEHADVRWGAHTFFLFFSFSIAILYTYYIGKKREAFCFFILFRVCACSCVCLYRTIEHNLLGPGRKSKQKPFLFFFSFFFDPLMVDQRERENIRAQSRLADSFIFLSVPDSRKKVEGEQYRGAPQTAFDTCGAR